MIFAAKNFQCGSQDAERPAAFAHLLTVLNIFLLWQVMVEVSAELLECRIRLVVALSIGSYPVPT